VLKGAGWPVVIQTRSPLIVRDKELVAGFERADVGFSVSTLDERYRKVFEPHAPPSQERFRAMRELSDRGIRTWLFLGPIIPGVTTNDVDAIIDAAKGSGARAVQFDRLRLRSGVWERLANVVPVELRVEFEFARRKGSEYFLPIEERIRRQCLKAELGIEPAF
jgi:DNA repair photolyase